MSDPINIAGATAYCHDCKKNVVTGLLEIHVYDFLHATGVVKGELLSLCATHHDDNRVWGKENLPQHNTFTIRRGRTKIGEIRASSMGAEAYITIFDRETKGKLIEQARLIRRERGY